MLLGGITAAKGAYSLTVFDIHFFFNRDPEGLESVVDLVERTHLAPYETTMASPAALWARNLPAR